MSRHRAHQKPKIDSNGTGNNGFRLQLKALVANKVKRFQDDIAKRHGKSNITEEWLYNRLKKLLLPGNFIACETCGMPMSWDSLTIDHKVPRSLHINFNGNIHNTDNLNIICPACNSLKGQRALPEFLTLLRARNDEIIKLSQQYKNQPQPPVIAPMYPDIGLGQKIFGPDKSYKRLKR
jgi:5-methylcytosine-specific restriction endonuclease McrA